MSADAPSQPRARQLGIPLPGTPGRWNAITDVPGVEVGQVTLIEGDDVRTGVTAILPGGRGGSRDTSFPAGWFSLNGNGEMTGTPWITESGSLTTPVLTTNTHSVGAVHAGAVRWLIDGGDPGRARWYMPVVAETYDGWLSDIDGQHVRPEHAIAALDAACPGPVAEGSVGGGTGMSTYEWKAGIGTSSRIVALGETGYVIGVLCQSNFGSRGELTIAGVPLGDLDEEPVPDPGFRMQPGSGSIVVVVATDAPLLPHQCQALARRVPLGLARTGATASHFSGDLFLAFSTAAPGALNSSIPAKEPHPVEPRSLPFLPWGEIDPLYTAVVQATEEAVLNALVAGTTMTGRSGRVREGLPVARVRERLAAAGRLIDPS
ncbi:MAG: P1 family peptidase [Protaetiibacter sp.]